MVSNTQGRDHYQARVRAIVELLGQRRVDDAVKACLALSTSNPESNDALLLLAKARQMQGRFEKQLTPLIERLQEAGIAL